MVINEFKRIAKDENLTVFGIGPASEMKNEPEGYRPEDLLPGVQSLICFGIALPKGVYAVGRNNWMRNKKRAARYMNITTFDEHTFHICSKCVSICPYGI